MTRQTIVTLASAATLVIASHVYADSDKASNKAEKTPAVKAAVEKTAVEKAPVVTEEQWKIDPSHSSAGFKVRHLMVTNVKGNFSDVQGEVYFDTKKPQNSRVKAMIGVESINTGSKKRDDHLRSPDFFDAKKYSKMTFESTKVQKAGKGYKVTGNLTIHGVTKPAVLKVTEFTKPVKNPFSGGFTRGVQAETKVDRKEFGLNWNKSLDAGGMVVGDEVAINLELELNKVDAVEKTEATTKVEVPQKTEMPNKAAAANSKLQQTNKKAPEVRKAVEAGKNKS